MKFNDVKKAIATCDSKYIEQITHNRMYFTKERKNAACSVNFFIEKMNEYIWKVDDFDSNKNDIQLTDKNTVVIYDNYDEVEEYALRKRSIDGYEDYSDLDGLDNNDIY